MLGYADTNNTSVTTVRVSGLPASVTTPGYLVYAYYDGDNGTGTGEHRVGRYEIGGISQWGRDPGARFDGTFTLGQTLIDPTILSGGATMNVPAAIVDTVPAGNYMILGPFIGPDFTLNVQGAMSRGGTLRGPLNGLQIVQIPEPSSVALLVLGALGGLGFLARRRARHA
jgi:hypothetical protein